MFRPTIPAPTDPGTQPITTVDPDQPVSRIIPVSGTRTQPHLDSGRPQRPSRIRRRKRRRLEGPEAMPVLVDRLISLTEGRECISMDLLARTIGAQGHAPLLLVAAIFMVLPTGLIPGIGGALGLLVAIIGLQMITKREGVFLPKFIGKRELPADKVRALVERVRPGAEWMRHRLRIRWELLSRGRISIIAISIIMMVSGASLLVIGAVPIATPLMGIPIALFAFGLLARDGVMVLFGYATVIAVTAAFYYIRTQAG
ncbi:MAG: exopolysaccharide biosynthesis protein [Pseudomonadota bacterium]|nr:exopolysaccharide biosynthesis protein [Pseudomonadota bacterium]